MACESQEDKSARFLYSAVSSKDPTVQTHLANQMQGFVSNPELFNLTTGIEMLGFPPKNFQQREGNSDMLWKGFLGKSCNQGSSSSKTINEQRSDLYHPQYSKQDFSTGFSETTNENLLVASDSGWQDNNRLLVDDSSLRCVFPCEGNERPSQGLSLSLSSNKPTGVEVKSFELRETSRLHGHDHHHHRQEEDDGGDIRFITTSATSSDGFLGRSENIRQQQQHKLLQDRIFGRASGLYETQFQHKNSKYLAPAQELLKEFCNLGAKQPDTQKHKTRSTNQLDDENGCGSSSRKQSSYAIDLLELQKRKAKLLSMLDEVDRRYRHYCDQMKAVVLSFEAVAGSGAATAYTALASKAMSRHFRSLRDGIVSQIQATKKALGEKDPVAPGTTRGETPRLRLLDQTFRQQKAFQQMTMLESHPWRPQRGLPERSVSVLRAWLFEHFLHPYPSDVDKHILARQAGLSRSQVSNWFINARVRLWKPMVEEMYLEETKDKDNMASSDGITGIDENIGRSNQNCSPAPLNPQTRSGDQKPTADQIIRMDSECLSSIINKTERHGIKKRGSHESDQQQPREQQHHHHSNFGRVGEAFGVVDLDFSSYNHQTPSNISYGHHGIHQNFGSGVSLTLGLQQHGTSGVSLAFSPPSQHSIFFPRDQIEDCQPVQYSILDGEAENLPYRDLLGAQLLHDFAG